jgi:hypothetical protein
MPSGVDSGATCAQRRDDSPRCAVAIPFEIAPLQPCHVARPAAVPPGHSSGSLLPHAASSCPAPATGARRHAADRAGGWPRHAGGAARVGDTAESPRAGRWGGRGRRGSAKMPFESPSMLPRLSSPLESFFFPACFERWVTSPGWLWRLPLKLGPMVSNDLLSVRAWAPVTRFSLRLSTTGAKPVGGDPIYPTASLKGPEIQRAASTSTIRRESAPWYRLRLFKDGSLW